MLRGERGTTSVLKDRAEGTLEPGFSLFSLLSGPDYIRLHVGTPIGAPCAAPSSTSHLAVPAAPTAEATLAHCPHPASPATPTPAGPFPSAPAGPQPATTTSHPPCPGCIPPQCPPWPSAPTHPDWSPSGASGTLALSAEALRQPEAPEALGWASLGTSSFKPRTEGTRGRARSFEDPGLPRRAQLAPWILHVVSGGQAWPGSGAL